MESKLDYSTAGSQHPGDLSGGKGGSGSSAAQQYLTSKYIRHSRAVAILWAVFTLCAAILNVVVFMSANWVGDTAASKGPGNFGLWKFCTVLSADPGSSSADVLNGGDDRGNVVCIGDLSHFASILSPAFRAATVFVGFSVIIMILCLVGFVLFCFMKANSVFEICGTMQFLSGAETKQA